MRAWRQSLSYHSPIPCDTWDVGRTVGHMGDSMGLVLWMGLHSWYSRDAWYFSGLHSGGLLGFVEHVVELLGFVGHVVGHVGKNTNFMKVTEV